MFKILDIAKTEMNYSFARFRLANNLQSNIKEEQEHDDNESLRSFKEELKSSYIKTEPKEEQLLEPCFLKKEPFFEAKEESTTESSKSIVNNGIIHERRLSNKYPTNYNLKRRRKRHSSTSENRATLGLHRRQIFSKIVRLHQTLAALDPDSLSNRQLSSLTWAESVIVRNMSRHIEYATKIRNNGIPVPCTSKNGSLDHQVDDKTVDISSSDESSNPFYQKDEPHTDTLQLAIVDFGKPGGRYPLKFAKLVEISFSKAIANHIISNPGLSAPKYGTASWYDGVTVLDCKDRLSYNFAKTAVPSIKLWEGANLKAVPPENLSTQVQGRIYVPNIGIDKENILTVLRSQNPSINIKKWKVIKEEVSNKGLVDYTVLIAEPPVRLLQNQQIRLFFGAGEVELKIDTCFCLQDD